MNAKRLMVIAGGTGGHVFPGIAIAHQLIKQGWKIRWLGTSNHIEADLVPKYGIDIEFIYINSFRGQGIKAFLLATPHIFNALYQAYRIIKKWQPDVVLGMGGYVSGPGSLAAWSCGIPVILHEQNRIAGLTNKWLAKIATKVLQAFPGALPQAKVVGNPVRTDILELPLTIERFNGRTGPLRILVIGGSQGAQIFNQIFPKLVAELGDLITVWHQTGKRDKETVKHAYRMAGQLQHKVTEFIDNIAEAYAWADIVVCRAGALTVSELEVAGLPAIFVPFQHKDRQQYWNALPLQKVGAAKILEQQNFNVVKLTQILRQLDRITLLTMAKRARQIAILDATDKIAQVIINIVQ